mgnify:CR=1 FL=1
MIKIWHISDTHGHHEQLKVPPNVDLVIHSGDASNFRDPYRNEHEMHQFLTWFSKLPIKNKLFVPGNHDTSIERGLIDREHIDSLGIELCIMNSITFPELNNLKVWGAPYVPRYGDWAYMKPRSKMMDKVWDHIDSDADIIVTHTPPQGILDYSDRRISDPNTGKSITVVEACGCLSLMKVINKINPKLNCFGHIHSTRGIHNTGTRTLPGLKTIFSNAACCVDGEKDRMTYNGNVIILDVS